MTRYRKHIYFVANVEFAVNAFLLSHIKKLKHHYDITIIVNTKHPNFLLNQGLKVRVITMRISRNIDPINDFFSLLHLFYIFLKDRPDAVHSITPKSGLLSMIASFFACIPLRVHTFTGQTWVKSTGLVKFLLKSVDILIAYLASFIVVDSHSQRLFLVEQGVLTFSNSIVFGAGSVCGVDLKRFKANKKTFSRIRRELSIPDSAFIFIYLGRITKDKGIFDLINAFTQISDKNIYLLIVGPNEQGLKEKILSLINFDSSRIRLIDHTDKPEVYLAASNVLCLPSYREGFGNVIIEAAAMGIPAIASNIYGVSDAIINKKTGILHQPKNKNDITNCMKFYLDNREKVKEYGVAAKSRVSIEFNSEILTDHWLMFYQSHI
jgi:glycosyltransferase involved in cell wall biosynthesis